MSMLERVRSRTGKYWARLLLVWFFAITIEFGVPLFQNSRVETQKTTVLRVHINDVVSSFYVDHPRPKLTNVVSIDESADKIDVVYMWVNHSEASYHKMRMDAERSAPGRVPWSPTIDQGELVLSIRSLFKFGSSWLGRIFILTNGGYAPSWVNPEQIKAGKVVLIDSDDLVKRMGGVTPSFNSHSIVTTFHTIPGISERFLALDDDFILARPTTASDYYNPVTGEEKFPYTFVKRPCKEKLPGLPAQCEAMKEVLQMGSYWCSHTVRPFRKTHLIEFSRMFGSYLNETRQHQFRHLRDIDITGVYPHFLKSVYNNRAIISSGNRHNWMTTQVIESLTASEWARYGRRPLTNIVLEDTSFRGPHKGRREEYLPIIKYMFKKKYGFQERSVVERTNNSTKSRVRVMGHRGFGVPTLDKTPFLREASNASLEQAAPLIDWIEIDVGITKDGVVVLAHVHRYLDENCQNFSKSNVLKDMFSYQLPEYVVTLEQALELANRTGVGLQIELKQDTDYGAARRCLQNSSSCEERDQDPLALAVFELLQATPNVNVIISSFEVGRLSFFADHGFPTVVSFPMFGSPEPYLPVIKSFGVTHLSVGFKFMRHQKEPQKLMQAIRKAGLVVELGMPGGSWCMHEKPRSAFETPSMIRHALELEPDILITNKPLFAMSVIHDEYHEI
mmetsp:Transcript_12501/g.26806  ORF Transcript_12501/g.26806 Transcript_12501/m.26806 type:complete len:676 (+) Transcript_12501:275-2302(+)